MNSAREGGFGAGVGLQGAKLEGGRKSTSAFEEEMVRTRTRFSVFELWYQGLIDSKAIGTFTGWGVDALDGVQAGDTIEFRAVLEVAPLQTLLRLYLWFADKAKSQGNIFSQKGDELKNTKEAERTMRLLLGAEEDEGQILLLAAPTGDAGPSVAMPISSEWLIGKIGRMGGIYTIVAQVNQVIESGAEFPTLRLTEDVAATPLELGILKESVAGFIEPAKALGITIAESDSSILGPALWLDPIAMYK